MKLINWVRFAWDLENLPPLAPMLPAHYRIAEATPEDEKEIRAVISRAFSLDAAWGDAIREVNAMLDRWLGAAFAEDNASALALRHGQRIIGASVLTADALAEDHLSPGPCVLLEYRNRGLGTALLAASLRKLRETGLARVVATAKANAPVARFLYPKFNGTLTPDDSPLLAA